jgi:peptidoglycan/xylan/chitin deacetylase (PgdA/CDA1 family)
VATVLTVPVVVVAVGVPAWWFVRAGASSSREAGVPAQLSVPEVTVTDAVRERLAELPERFEGIPVINYHDISDGESRYTLTPEQFAQHMAVLEEAGITTVTLDDVSRHLAGTAQLPDRPVLITFDDGTSSVYVAADPILAAHGFNAVSFLVTSTTSRAARSYHLNEVTIAEMVRSGRWEFGAHTHDLHHLVDTGRGEGPAMLNRERREDGTDETLAEWRARVSADLDRNVELIERFTGVTPTAFAYPFSAHRSPTNDPAISREAPELVDARFPLRFTAGLKEMVAIDGVEQDLSSPLPRLSVQDDLSPEELAEALVRMTRPRVPTQLTAATLAADGQGRCVASPGRISIDATDYTACRTQGHRAIATEARIRTRVLGNDRRSTAVIGFEGRDARLELAIGESRARLRTRNDGDWRVLAEAPVTYAGDRTVEAVLEFTGDRVRAVVGGVAIDGTCSDCGRFSNVVLAVATQERGLSFLEPTLEERLRRE